MDSLEALLKPIRHSPRLPQAVALLQEQIANECNARDQFYREMPPDQKVEFIDGEVILHSPARNRHLDVTLWIATLLRAHVGLQQLGTVKVEKCLCVFPRNDYEPDIVYFGLEKTQSIQADTMKFPVPDMVVEVLSPSTETRDRGVKFEDFAANRLGEYWIVDADKSVIEQYVLHDSNFELVLKSSSGRISSPVIAGFQSDIEAFFDEQKNLIALRALLH